MGQLGRAALKAFFETGDIPTEAQFADLIDSFLNLTDDVGGDAADLIRGTITFTSAQILDLSATPIDVLPVPGAGFAYHFVAVTWETIGVGTPYDTWLQFEFIGSTATIPHWQNTSLLTSTVDRIGNQTMNNVAGTGNTQIIENEKVICQVRGGNPLNGDFDVKIDYIYRIMSV